MQTLASIPVKQVRNGRKNNAQVRRCERVLDGVSLVRSVHSESIDGVRTSFKFADLISVSKSDHSSTWFPAIPIQPLPISMIKGFTLSTEQTFKFHLLARLAAENSDLSLMPLVHHSAEHCAGRRAVSVADCDRDGKISCEISSRRCMFYQWRCFCENVQSILPRKIEYMECSLERNLRRHWDRNIERCTDVLQGQLITTILSFSIITNSHGTAEKSDRSFH